MPGPLEGITIVEMGTMIAVPGCTHLLATQGASVVKVEDTATGDSLRFYGSNKNGMSGWFANANAGKRSIALDLSADEGKEVLWKLLGAADVFIQGFRPGAVDRLGFGPEAVMAHNAALVYVSSAGFGLDGPYAEEPVYDPIIQALSGWAGGQTVAGAPTLIKGFVADKVAAMTTAQAITAALFSRHTSGRGQHIEMSMLEANVAFLWPDVMMHATLLDEDATHLPNLLGHYVLFPSSDGWVSVATGTDKQWQGLCNALDRADILADERFATGADRNANSSAWYDAIGEMCSAFPSTEVVARCKAADVPAVPVYEPAEVVNDAQIVARGAIQEVDHPIVGQMRVPRQGARFEGDGESVLTPAPSHGQHTSELLDELGYDADAVAALRSAGTVL
ncbi:MAG: CaiB/BaiF CoA transferase family protein [Microthrixaceae bacterium]